MRTTILLAIAITAVAACRSETDKDRTWLGTTSTQSEAKHPGSPGSTAVKKAAGDPIAENGTRTVSAVLQPGTYTLYCPILDHSEKGELTTFTVRG